uniref:Uncharacterized protein n=1 Tax=Anguilla anguilla TaxID=7936 RepID=A0A0E9PV63_ANGAN
MVHIGIPLLNSLFKLPADEMLLHADSICYGILCYLLHGER